MTEPVSAAAGGTLAHKIGMAIVLALVAMAAPMLAFVLGLQVIPISEKDPHGDVVRRLLGCAVSSFMVGIPALIALHHFAPWVFESAIDLGQTVGMPEVGIMVLIGCVLLQAALPGWWLVGSLVRKYAGWDKKTITEVATELRQDIKQATVGE